MIRRSCVECGLPFPIQEKGFLYIYSQPLLVESFRSFSFPFIQKDNTILFPYEEKETLKKIIDSLLRLKIKNLFAYTGQKKDKIVQPMISIETLYERIKTEPIVDFIAKGNLVSHFQPIVQLQDFSIYGYESLLRSSDTNIQINPGELFQVAQQTGLHSLLDQRARETAVKSRVNKIGSGVKSFINFLPSTIYNPKFCLQHTFSIVEKYNVEPEDLVFEVVETEKITDVNFLVDIFNTYKESGMKVALDDVGAGYATLEMLKKLSPDYVKVDRQFISYCDQNVEKQSFLQEVMNIAKGMGIKILGEGIERKEELDYCRSIDMDLAQGYYIGKPQAEPVNKIFVI
ncbi:EAL domain-containing protein (putative c-di-GMP-specific phosphodiesterase class I) [Salirhabdus euzebyi]|uniref:EAL domain-containing protein (Putative c-di-GMP-specific phosphodiesterase class I) n=1 Tax=Salirhabdus euzebyi TaxID=394506 RepID=A0A841Q521_9BACI|nr:EAL domain-containing protein [Salirhabdus euzebyi]MBB6453506.1 EAL domain-containing protein (putative c-di-GMP-specific phosphodiesterase class I) [Salirhabdus euzebyi]